MLESLPLLSLTDSLLWKSKFISTESDLSEEEFLENWWTKDSSYPAFNDQKKELSGNPALVGRIEWVSDFGHQA